MKQDPTTLVRPGALIRNFRMMFRVLRIFWPELVGAVIAAAALSGFAVALGENNISSFAKSALGFIAITGFSVAGLTAKLKNQAQAMVTRLRQDVYTDLVAVAITTAPPDPSTPNRPSRQNSKKARLARERTITPVTPN
jgi:putative Ca2+/H+ antiporter (TMEM165/GDT1 family)